MAALLHALPFAPDSRPATRTRPARPPLPVVHGGRAQVAVPPVATVLLLLALALGAVVVVLRLAQGAPPATTWRELTAASAADPAPVAAPGDLVLTVAPGDTLWGIARRLAPERDPRPIVAALERANGGTVLQIGQRLVVPAELVG